MTSVHDIIVRPIVTERSMEAASSKKYAFEVARGANKIEIRKAVEAIFGVEVLSVNTINMRGKKKRLGVHKGARSSWKKAIVQLRPSSKGIEFFEGMV
jgi:large subunit ribosomal protein L23